MLLLLRGLLDASAEPTVEVAADFSPWLVAVQGIGAGSLAVALQGFAAFGYIEPTPVTPIGGGGGYAFDDTFYQQLQLQIQQEDEILILAVAHMVVQGVFV